MAKSAAAPAPAAGRDAAGRWPDGKEDKDDAGSDGEAPPDAPVRTQFADTAFWAARVRTDARGEAEVAFTLPENLTAWKARVWAMGPGTRVGEGSAEVVTAKDLIVRLQAPRFFVETDEVVLSANVHNYLDGREDGPGAARARRRLPGADGRRRRPADGRHPRQGREARRLAREGRKRRRGRGAHAGADRRRSADAMQMNFPVLVHGMAKTGPADRGDPAGADRGEPRLQGAGRAAGRRLAARAALLADAGRRHGRRPALSRGLPLRLHRADPEPLPADRHHPAGAAGRWGSIWRRSGTSRPT